MNVLQDLQKLAIKKKVPEIRAGYTVRVHQKIKEGEKERVQMFEGLVIKVNSGHGADKTFTVRKVIGGIGVEKIFALYSTNIEKIEVKKISKVRRSKLYYMRDRFGKSARLKETLVSDKDQVMTDGPVETQAEPESPKTEETPTEEKANEAESAEEPKKEEEAPEAPAEEEKAKE